VVSNKQPIRNLWLHRQPPMAGNPPLMTKIRNPMWFALPLVHLVAALKAAEYVDALSNAGPFTVFAPTNAAFDKLPAGTVETLTKPENKDKLRTILEYHVYVGMITENLIQDGMTLNQVSLDNIKLGKEDEKITVNGANVLGVARGSNGIVYIIDTVLLPPDKK
jgi:uncharacterized surface protein with fasciclin (FAS1) repeats